MESTDTATRTTKEEIKAAIDRLTGLRVESSQGEWSPITQNETDDGAAQFVLGSGPTLDGDFNNVRHYADADLIATMHATLGLQTALLWMATGLCSVSNKTRVERALVALAKDLAIAINGAAK